MKALQGCAVLFFIMIPVLLLSAALFFLLCLAFDIPPLTGTGALHGTFFAAGVFSGLSVLFSDGHLPKKRWIPVVTACICLAFPPVRMFAFMLLAGAATGFVAFVVFACIVFII